MGDGGQGLAAKPVGGDRGQIVEAAQLGGREALAEDREVIFADTSSVVSDLEPFYYGQIRYKEVSMPLST